MSPSLKKLYIFSLAAALGEKIRKESSDEAVIWRAEKLEEAGKNAINHCKVKVDNNAIKRVYEKISQVCDRKDEHDATEMLSFLLLGLQDLSYYSKGNETLNLIEKRALWFIKLFDPKLEDEEKHEAAYKKYEAWVG